MFLPTWLPAGFRESGSSLTTENYAPVTGRPHSPRIELGFTNHPGPLGRVYGGRPVVAIQGRHGRIESGPRRRISVYWKPDNVHILSVTGYRVPAATVLTIAKNVWFNPPGLLPLPISAGRVVGRRTAIEMARQASGLGAAHAVARLSSWAEVAALLEAARSGSDLRSVPGAFATERWQPVWAVLVSDGVTATVVVIDAITGRPVVTIPTSGRPAWFSALTDRGRTAPRRCQGGSHSRLPFGVLTRNEETFVASSANLGTSHATTSFRLKLTTVRAMNKADSGIYGGCVQQSCSISELIWVVITTVRADPGTTVECVPASYPPVYRPSRVKQYFDVSVLGNVGTYCRNLPGPIVRLKDLAPPLGPP
jgi:hypothetical protein